MDKELKISAENALAAYKNTDANGKELLEHLFDKELFAPDIKERVKTFEDAIAVLGENHPLVHQYAAMYDALNDNDVCFGDFKDAIAYMKLRIIVASLNEGWRPTFSYDEYRYYPWFYLYTKAEYEELDEDEKKDCRVVGRSYHHANGGVVYAGAGNASAHSSSYYGSRLAFKTRELAEYCGKQFIDIWEKWLFM